MEELPKKNIPDWTTNHWAGKKYTEGSSTTKITGEITAKYIKLEDVQNILSKYSCDIRGAENDINSLPSIDFKEMIKQEIQEWNDKWDGEESYSPIYILEEISNKLP